MEANMNAVLTERIVRTPGTCGGRARIAGHRIRVMDVVFWHERDGMSPDEIVANFPTITLGDVHTALAYYYDNPDEIREDIRTAEQTIAAFLERNPTGVFAGQKE